MFFDESPSADFLAEQIIVSQNELPLMELLYLRSLWQLSTHEVFPVLEPQTPSIEASGSNGLADRSEQWDQQWILALNWIAQAQSRNAIFQELLEAPDPDRLSGLLPPRWISALSDPLFDEDSWFNWLARVPVLYPDEFAGGSVMRSLEPLEAARQRGLRVIAVLPFSGDFYRETEQNVLLLSSSTYMVTEKYEGALENWRG